MVLLILLSIADGRRLLIGYYSDYGRGFLNYFNIAQWKSEKFFQAHNGTIWSVAISKDARYGLTTGDDGISVIKYWDLPYTNMYQDIKR